MHMTKAIVLAISLAASLSAIGAAEETAPAPQQTVGCKGDEHRQLDFWLGTWRAKWQGGEGTNQITRDFEDCVIREAFDAREAMGGFRGMSVSLYHAQTKQWRQTWVDNQGSYFDLVGGPEGDDFVLTNVRLTDSAPHLRMVFTKIKPDSFTWRWQKSTDGKAWTDSWVIEYERKT
jgi:hypothetical protein